MSNTWVTDMQHYLDGAGGLGKMPGAALNLALLLGSIVSWMTSRPAAELERTNVPCRRSPGRRRCTGEIYARFDSEEIGIIWECLTCHDNGYIHGWERTPWDRGHRGIP
jgi:hypothetical protein